MMQRTRRRARERGLEYNLTIEDYECPKKCPVLGIPLIPNGPARSKNSPSIDRIDSTKGYIKGNTRIISWRANNLKKDGSLQELIAVAIYVATNLEKASDKFEQIIAGT